jgi:acyl-CoA thioesterase FadM
MTFEPTSSGYLRKLKKPGFLESHVNHPFSLDYQVPGEERDFNKHRGADHFLPDITRTLIGLFEQVYGLSVDTPRRFPGVKVIVRERAVAHWAEVFVGDQLTLSTGLWHPYKGARFVQALRSVNQKGKVVFTASASYCFQDTNRDNALVRNLDEIFTPQV